jgi:hypothetical protein
MTANERLVAMISQFVSGVTLETNGSFRGKLLAWLGKASC